jgi:hypothetical protein
MGSFFEKQWKFPTDAEFLDFLKPFWCEESPCLFSKVSDNNFT